MIKRDDSKTVKELISIFVNHELESIGKDSGSKTFDVSLYLEGVAYNGAVYPIMDDLCDELVNNGWHCYYRHYYTFVQRCYLVISPNEIKDRPNNTFKHFVPYDKEYIRIVSIT